MRRFIVSFAIFLFAWLPMFFIGLPVTFLLLLTSWDGKSTWSGNYLYGRLGNAHTPKNPTLFDSWLFLAIRNPISNFGKMALAKRANDPTAYLEEKTHGWFKILYGWKNEDPRLTGTRAFVFRPSLNLNN